jgi:hypothetical protein
MTKNNKIAGAVLLVFFAIALFMARSFPTQSSYFPTIICVLGILLSVILIVSAFVTEARGKGKPAKPLTSKAKKMIAIMTGLIVLYAIGMKTIGFAVSTFIYIVVSGLILYPEKITKENKKPILIVVLSALIVSVLITVVFKKILYVPLPSGLLI